MGEAREGRARWLLSLLSFGLLLFVVGTSVGAWEWIDAFSERRRVRTLTVQQLIDQIDGENWIIGERLAELGDAAVPELLAVASDPRSQRGVNAAIGLVWCARSAADDFAALWECATPEQAQALWGGFLRAYRTPW